MLGLEGVKIVELGHRVSAAYVTKLMADLSADVIKVTVATGRHKGPGRTGEQAQLHGGSSISYW